jgi:hypothetical protein
VSIVAPQALALLNNDFVHAQSAALAERVRREAPGDETAQIDRAWWLALGRPPRAGELAAAVAHLKTQRENLARPPAADAKPPADDQLSAAALASLCHVLVNLNEFIYVD